MESALALGQSFNSAMLDGPGRHREARFVAASSDSNPPERKCFLFIAAHGATEAMGSQDHDPLEPTWLHH